MRIKLETGVMELSLKRTKTTESFFYFYKETWLEAKRLFEIAEIENEKLFRCVLYAPFDGILKRLDVLRSLWFHWLLRYSLNYFSISIQTVVGSSSRYDKIIHSLFLLCELLRACVCVRVMCMLSNSFSRVYFVFTVPTAYVSATVFRCECRCVYRGYSRCACKFIYCGTDTQHMAAGCQIWTFFWSFNLTAVSRCKSSIRLDARRYNAQIKNHKLNFIRVIYICCPIEFPFNFE